VEVEEKMLKTKANALSQMVVEQDGRLKTLLNALIK